METMALSYAPRRIASFVTSEDRLEPWRLVTDCGRSLLPNLTKVDPWPRHRALLGTRYFWLPSKKSLLRAIRFYPTSCRSYDLLSGNLHLPVHRIIMYSTFLLWAFMTLYWYFCFSWPNILIWAAG
ncbi:uncharacterized protein BO96DRAFT_132963 [Aspergillus niger CBS 101883]|uniref:uncharacterized protein n=1 Tax=Aspergillus lacticoffeatus (strain CBS 101883) TaxID=1450533 RepID=UPI000D7EF4C1|nr:uncharacterized protein BO96DRAFT_132963 [Aspergillus niger CBS 101883]PYH53056.1 hypothetical protein BO96DRAFT_132963 [Aspergillus niger CBS 101883]